MPEKTPIQSFNFKQAAEAVLKTLKRDRDRQILARRFGFDLAKRQTLEQIGKHFGITRERVRQIEKATLAKVKTTQSGEVRQANSLLLDYLAGEGGLSSLARVVELVGLQANQQAYVQFLATLSSDVEVIEEDDQLRQALAALPKFSKTKVRQLSQQLVDVYHQLGKPAPLSAIASQLPADLNPAAIVNIAQLSKRLASHENQWGLVEWPQVNPKSIRDKTYLVLSKHGKPLHFGDIAEHIKDSNFSRRDVTIQAVHNELIKDSRFVLIGRGIYALAEWGYTPGTVADIIIEILKGEAPLHKDEIVRRVLKKRQVKTTTIVLNLQEKDHFERVAKATYKLKGQ
ncbi:MAG TPA: sigma factor-like helix-turn-helix DNA-binding protein [Candidatus Nanoarchaeia archaeon]|nr:sigma factor-like helix-turn-helix DNA-binding protein [Candidatus Nanoarchaeia archaeon]